MFAKSFCCIRQHIHRFGRWGLRRLCESHYPAYSCSPRAGGVCIMCHAYSFAFFLTAIRVNQGFEPGSPGLGPALLKPLQYIWFCNLVLFCFSLYRFWIVSHDPNGIFLSLTKTWFVMANYRFHHINEPYHFNHSPIVRDPGCFHIYNYWKMQWWKF